MRLVDADKLSIIKEKLRIFDSFISAITRQCTDEHIAIYEHWIDCRYDIENIIDKLPTAYSVEKVVEQLEEKLTCEDYGTCGYCQNRWCPMELLEADKAIDIVRKGGTE